MPITKFRWAIIGTGAVAGKFALGLRSSPGAELALVASRTAARAEAFASQLGASAWVDSYEAAADAAVDAVYIATPPSEHLRNALLFIEAGKAVLIEKPLAASAAEGQAIVDAAKAAGVLCVEAMWTRFLPAMAMARKAIAEGRIGQPMTLAASFATPAVVDANDSLFRADLGGGALAHRGVYPIALALDLLGPATLGGAAVTWGTTGVDEEAVAVMAHTGGAISHVHAGARTQADNSLTILGTTGRLRLVGPIYRPQGVAITPYAPTRRRDRPWTRAAILREGALAQGLNQRLEAPRAMAKARHAGGVSAPYMGNGYPHEAIALMDALRQGWLEHPLSSHAASLATLRLVDQIRASSPRGTPA